MATRRGKSASKVVVKRPPHAALTLTIPVLKPRNPLAMNPLLKKSVAHAASQGRNKRERDGALDVQQDVQEALNRRGGGADKGGNDGGASD